MSEQGPIRFYAVSHGSYDDYCESFVLATTPEDALRRFIRSDPPSYNVIGTVWEADLNSHGVIRKVKELYEIEIVGTHGYLWAESKLSKGVICCVMCGAGPSKDESPTTFLDANKKCSDCAKYKIFIL